MNGDMGDVLDQALQVVESIEARHYLKRSAYFSDLAMREMLKRESGELLRVSSTFSLHVFNPEDEAEIITLWIVTMLDTSTLRVVNLIYRECNHGRCEGHLVRIMDDRPITNDGK